MLVGVQEGRTAVHLAAMNGHHDTLKALLLFGVEVNDRDTVRSTLAIRLRTTYCTCINPRQEIWVKIFASL